MERAQASGLALNKRLLETAQKRGVKAAWKMLFNAICNEGVYVSEASPSALVTYQAYVSIAAGFLKGRPDAKMALELTTRIDQDLGQFRVFFNGITKAGYTEDEYITVMASMKILKTTIESIIALHQK